MCIFWLLLLIIWLNDFGACCSPHLEINVKPLRQRFIHPTCLELRVVYIRKRSFFGDYVPFPKKVSPSIFLECFELSLFVKHQQLGRPGHIPGKSSNECWAFQELSKAQDFQWSHLYYLDLFKVIGCDWWFSHHLIPYKLYEPYLKTIQECCDVPVVQCFPMWSQEMRTRGFEPDDPRIIITVARFQQSEIFWSNT